MTVLEICVEDSDGVDAALAGGADRLGLCTALVLGGLTPTPSLVRYALAAADGRARVRAMVRPRAGDFVYTAAELACADEDAAVMIAAGIDGLVFGVTRDGGLDREALADWVARVRGARSDVALTLHRAIDAVADPVGGIADARMLGFDRILTSGGASGAPAGASTIARMVAAAGADGPVIMAGAGVRPENVAALVAATGVREIHASASVPASLGDPAAAALGFDDPLRRVTDLATVRAIRAVVDRP